MIKKQQHQPLIGLSTIMDALLLRKRVLLAAAETDRNYLWRHTVAILWRNASCS